MLADGDALARPRRRSPGSPYNRAVSRFYSIDDANALVPELGSSWPGSPPSATS